MSNRPRTRSSSPREVEQGQHRPNRKLGQNFLIDRNTINRILELLNPTQQDRFLEIGAGTGVLTGPLSKIAAEVYAVELDRSLIPALQNIPGIHVMNSDILKLDLSEFASSGSIRIVGNLPYYISTAILSKLLRSRDLLQDMTLMFQEEVAQRILSAPSRAEYGLISVLSQYFCEIQKGFRISKNCFSPRPKVESRVLRFQFRKDRALTYSVYHDFLVHAFSQRRKKLRNNLLRTLSIPEEKIDLAFRHLELSENIRAENLSPDQFEALILLLQ